MATHFMPASYAPRPNHTPTAKDLKQATISEAATALATGANRSLGALCPVSGLFQPLGLVPLPGMVLDAMHPICFNALQILRHPAYWQGPATTPEFKVALSLAALNALGKLRLDGPAVVINLALRVATEPDALDTFLTFILERMLTTDKHYPSLALSSLPRSLNAVNDRSLHRYVALCVDVENTRALNELAGPQIKAPSLLSSVNKGKALNGTCHDAWLELAPFLPSGLVTKAKPFVKDLATSLHSTTIGKLLAACTTNIEECRGDNELLGKGSGELELSEFLIAVNKSRESARLMGLHRSALDDEPLGLSPLTTIEELKAPPELATLATQSEPTTVANRPLSFSEKLKARKAAGGANNG